MNDRYYLLVGGLRLVAEVEGDETDDLTLLTTSTTDVSTLQTRGESLEQAPIYSSATPERHPLVEYLEYTADGAERLGYLLDGNGNSPNREVREAVEARLDGLGDHILAGVFGLEDGDGFDVELYDLPRKFEGGTSCAGDDWRGSLEKLQRSGGRWHRTALRIDVTRLVQPDGSSEDSPAPSEAPYSLFGGASLFVEELDGIHLHHSGYRDRTDDEYSYTKEHLWVGDGSKVFKGVLQPQRGGYTHLSTNHSTGRFSIHFDPVAPTPLDTIESIRFAVWPHKLSVDEAESIFTTVFENHHRNLLSPTGDARVSLRSGDSGRLDPIQQLRVLDWFFRHRKLEGTYRAITRNPDKRLRVETPNVAVQKARSPAPGRLAKAFSSPDQVALCDGESGCVELDDGSLVPRRVDDRRSHVDYDTLPNRFAKFVLGLMERVCRTAGERLLEAEADEERPERTDALLSMAHRRLRDVRSLQTPRFWDEVSKLSALGDLTSNQVLLQEPRYRRIFEMYRRLRRGLQLVDDPMQEAFSSPVHRMYTLYEYWCWFRLCEVVEEVLESSEDPALRRDGENLTVGKNQIRREWKTDAGDLRLFYNWSTSSGDAGSPYDSWSVSLRPDIGLEVERRGGSDRLVVFDAKYRVDIRQIFEESDETDDEETLRREKEGDFKRGDLYKMHTYRDALRSGNNQETAPNWVIALYPGTKGKLYRRSGDALTETSQLDDRLGTDGGVGAIPCRPTSQKDADDNLNKWSKQLLRKLVEE